MMTGTSLAPETGGRLIESKPSEPRLCVITAPAVACALQARTDATTESHDLQWNCLTALRNVGKLGENPILTIGAPDNHSVLRWAITLRIYPVYLRDLIRQDAYRYH